MRGGEDPSRVRATCVRDDRVAPVLRCSNSPAGQAPAPAVDLTCPTPADPLGGKQRTVPRPPSRACAPHLARARFNPPRSNPHPAHARGACATGAPARAQRVRGHSHHTEHPHELSGLLARGDAPQAAPQSQRRFHRLRSGCVPSASCATGRTFHLASPSRGCVATFAVRNPTGGARLIGSMPTM